jgi:hypothetical protein
MMAITHSHGPLGALGQLIDDSVHQSDPDGYGARETGDHRSTLLQDGLPRRLQVRDAIEICPQRLGHSLQIVKSHVVAFQCSN